MELGRVCIDSVDLPVFQQTTEKVEGMGTDTQRQIFPSGDVDRLS